MNWIFLVDTNVVFLGKKKQHEKKRPSFKCLGHMELPSDMGTIDNPMQPDFRLLAPIPVPSKLLGVVAQIYI